MRARVALFLLLLVVFAPTGNARADGRWSLGLAAGWQRFDQDYGIRFHGDPDLIPADAIEYGGRVSYLLGKGFGLELAGGWCPTQLQQAGRDMATLHASSVTLRLAIDPEPGRWGAPYLGAGGGGGILYVTDPEPGFIAPWVGTGADTLKSAFYPGYLDLAAGWTFRLSDPLHLRLEARQPLWIHEDSDGWHASNPGMTTFGAVLTWHSGAHGKDADEDGVPDRDDKCANTPPGARVDRTGCPLDGDGDGVFDGIDWCPNSPAGALVDERGCGKDSDRDGVVDGTDRCPNTPRKCAVNADGCPLDADGDGVCDALDRCSATPRGWTVNDEGCPLDADGDGISDGADQCPRTPRGVQVDGNGCPRQLSEMEAELARTGSVKLPIVFEPGLVSLPSENESALDLAGLLIARWPSLRFEIVAQPGSAERSASTIGEWRARTIRDELARRASAGPSQLTSRGRAPTSATRTRTPTPARVDLVALDRTALRKEAERRGLIKPPPPAKAKAPAPKPATTRPRR